MLPIDCAPLGEHAFPFYGRINLFPIDRRPFVDSYLALSISLLCFITTFLLLLLPLLMFPLFEKRVAPRHRSAVNRSFFRFPDSRAPRVWHTTISVINKICHLNDIFVRLRRCVNNEKLEASTCTSTLLSTHPFDYHGYNIIL